VGMSGEISYHAVDDKWGCPSDGNWSIRDATIHLPLKYIEVTK